MASASSSSSSKGAPIDTSRWLVIYPNYVDSKKTIAEGRRIAQSAAAETPTLIEMIDICKFFEIPVIPEDKSYPRDWLVRGRLRVQLKNEAGVFHNQELKCKMDLLKKMGELIPKLKSRAPGGAGGASASSSSGGGGKNKKKKGKK
uniref:Signal recognition particle 19 kDa protein n=1 Tax=Chromera velia CCMP2878 TaxID=1169474 RepID=A0A0G4G383_9ALVE|eukprot:Cvel_19919.t1-p1 / transcript=Cvel_19919.t1 / gene=Cvel_19919 / organism=Chromera_velia_CCMP2878 / gene_product=Signal recognition particle 19 kDa protein, putative / transcript_product=Signal recognition particle 19 kDa protein, putative / location=Cvel_scaffold1752:5223-7840(+) / protein_length=145 / sequence_SO=supercontig / SO=protein_coding / is_pseudo=false